MRNLLALSFAAFCLCLAGCQGTRPGKGAGAQPTSGRGQTPFLGTPVAPSATASAPSAAESGNLASGGNSKKGQGVLAGRILDQDSRLRPGAIIQVVDLESSREGGAPLSVMANREGYFDIDGLEVGRSYRLIARVKDGTKVYSGSARVVPPNVRIAIWLTDEAPAESPVADAGSAPPEGKAPAPAASLGPPVKNPSSGVTTPLPGSPESPPGPTSSAPPVPITDPSLIGDGKGAAVRDGIQREEPPKVSVPSPSLPGRDHAPEKPAAPLMPPPPPATAPAEEKPAAPTPAPPTSSAQADIPRTSTVVPSCRRVGLRVENFALYDTRGEVFELEKDRKGKLVLLDLWHTNCPPCLRAIPHLNDLQSKYGKYGLEVIGITYEPGTLAEKQASLEQARRRRGLRFDYRLLFGGGGQGACPVAQQLEVRGYPTLVLLDESGRILHRCTGFDEQSKYELEMAIYQKLFSKRMAGR